MDEEDFDLFIEELIHDRHFGKSSTEIETYESEVELKHSQEYVSDHSIFIILDDIHEKERYDPRAQAMFKRSRHSIISILLSVKIITSYQS